MAAPNEDDFSFSQAVRIAGLIHKRREKELLTEEEEQELDNWLKSSESNKRLYESLNNREQLANELDILMEYDEDKAVSDIFQALGERPPAKVKKMKTIVRRLSVAASFLLLAGAAWWFFSIKNTMRQEETHLATIQAGNIKAILTLADGSKVILDSTHTGFLGTQGAARVEQQKDRLVYTAADNGQQVYNSITTPRGGQYQVHLPDGSDVWLNAASSITYPTSFMGNTREVTVTGEAYFSVAKNKAKPFIVTAGEMNVKVVGTEFDVMAYNDEDAVRTTLIKGIVKAGNISNHEELMLKPGEQATLTHQSGVLKIEKTNIDEVTGWRFGEFRFHEASMAAIMRQVARWYDVKVEFRDSAAGIILSGQISRKESVEELLGILSETRNVHFEMKGDTLVVIPGAEKK